MNCTVCQFLKKADEEISRKWRELTAAPKPRDAINAPPFELRRKELFKETAILERLMAEHRAHHPAGEPAGFPHPGRRIVIRG